MATITEDYVSFEITKLLKEKGFDVPCLAHWFIGSEAHEEFSDRPFNWNEVKSDLDWLSRPTQQMAMKWLREVHNIHIVIKIVIRTYGDTEYYYELYGTKNKSLCVVCDIYKGESWNSSEQAAEAAIKYCLKNLI